MTKRLIDRVAFTITGEYIVEDARHQVLSGTWLRAIQSMRESLIGFTFEHAVQVLSGEMTLEGDSNVGIDMVEDKSSADYIREMKEVYLSELFYESGTLYKFVRKVGNIEFKNMMERYSYAFDASFVPEKQLEAVERYLSDRKTEKVFRINAVEYIIAVPTEENLYPMWFKRSDYNNSHMEFYRNY